MASVLSEVSHLMGCGKHLLRTKKRDSCDRNYSKSGLILTELEICWSAPVGLPAAKFPPRRIPPSRRVALVRQPR